MQAVAIFYPVTDLLNLGQSTENPGDGGPPKTFVNAFGPDATDMAAWKKIGRECSPIYYITKNLPPTLIYHGDADTLVPLEQSEWFRDRATALNRDGPGDCSSQGPTRLAHHGLGPAKIRRLVRRPPAQVGQEPDDHKR